MRVIQLGLLGAAVLFCAFVHADEATEREVRQAIIDSNQYTRENLVGRSSDYSSEGSIEFWSSGGLMQEISPDSSDAQFDSFNVDVKHIHVTTLVPGEIAVAHYYSEGSIKPKGSAEVPHYFTRVSQVLVKEAGKWKVRASHWSPVMGGSGTSQSAIDE